jgi:CRP/FNR family nitrogen fixation transcriptional regulator
MLHWRSDAEHSRAAVLDEHNQLPPTTPAAGAATLIGGCRHYSQDVEIFSQLERVSDVYSVVSGAVRFTRLLKDGRRQIGAFYLPGELFGLESEERHTFSAETVVNSRIGISRRSTFLDQAMQDMELALRVWSATAAHLQRAQSHLTVLGRGTAQERMATFLLDMHSRLGSSDTIQLPMPRRDIADYLGLTIETVSRIFHLFQRRGFISIPEPRRIVFRNPQALYKINDA